jgi:hypothetical protein
VPLATTEVRHARRTAAADITAAQHVGVWCEDPSKFPFGTFEDVSATLPNQAQAGVPFTITITGTTRAAAIGVTGGTVDGATVTPTGPQGTTVDVTYLLDSFGDPDFPFRACNQLAGPVHLATIPIVRH